MRHLSQGPQRVSEGPIGRCVKRRWCRVLMEPAPGGEGSVVVYALTESGRALLEG